MGGGLAAKGGDKVKPLIDELTDALDVARSRTASDDSVYLFEILRRYVSSKLRRHGVELRHLNDLANDVGLSVAMLLHRGSPSVDIAKQIPVIVTRRIADFFRDKLPIPTEKNALMPLLEGPENATSDFEDVEAAIEIEPLRLALTALKIEDRRGYEATIAHLNGDDVARHLSTFTGEEISRDYARKIRERARETLARILGAKGSLV